MSVTKKMIVDCMRREMAIAIPQRSKSMPSHQVPLWAWMQGAKLVGRHSRIEAVLDNQCRWPWRTLNASGHTFIHRVLKKKSLPWLQKNWLHAYIARRYQGAYEYPMFKTWHDFNYTQKQLESADAAEYQTLRIFESCLEKLKIKQHEIPLRLILSAELSALINLKFMEFYK